MKTKKLITLKSGVVIRCFENEKNIYAELHGTMMFANAAAEEARIAVLIDDGSEESFGVLFGDSGHASWSVHMTTDEAMQLHELLPHVAFKDEHRLKMAVLATSWLDKNCLILDTETTGLGDDDEVVEISIIDAQRNVLMNSLVKPSKPIPQAATDIHGITNEMVANAPTWDQLHDEFVSVISNSEQPLVIYNDSFDIRLLNNTARIYGIRPAYFTSAFVRKYNNVFCAMKAYAELYGQWDHNKQKYKWQKLTNAVKQCGYEVEGAHRSLSDCQMTLQVLQFMAVNGGAA